MLFRSIKEFLHPGVQEIADILPLSLGKFLLNTAWARGLVAKLAGQGRIIETSHLGGFLQLYAIASLRPLRPRSHRFQHEQTQINTWLGEISALMKEDYELAMQYAECPRLLKGYGETYERGRKNFEIIVGALPQLRGRADAAAKFESLTKAALADDSGAALSDVMKQVLK